MCDLEIRARCAEEAEQVRGGICKPCADVVTKQREEAVAPAPMYDLDYSTPAAWGCGARADGDSFIRSAELPRPYGKYFVASANFLGKSDENHGAFGGMRNRESGAGGIIGTHVRDNVT